MADKELLAAVLTVALSPAKSGGASKKVGSGQVSDVLNNYNRFLKALEKADYSIDRRGINPD